MVEARARFERKLEPDGVHLALHPAHSSDSAFAAAVVSVRMVAIDLMVFAGMELGDAVETVREGIEARKVPPPPKAARPFSWRRWLRMPFSRTQ